MIFELGTSSNLYWEELFYSPLFLNNNKPYYFQKPYKTFFFKLLVILFQLWNPTLGIVLLQPTPCFAIFALLLYSFPAIAIISSTHLLLGWHLFHLPIGPSHIVVSTVHLLSVHHARYPTCFLVTSLWNKTEPINIESFFLSALRDSKM